MWEGDHRICPLVRGRSCGKGDHRICPLVRGRSCGKGIIGIIGS